jgi:hypothetical protein
MLKKMENPIKSRPIIFSSMMIRAIQDKLKTQTRRIIRFPKHAYSPNLDWIKSIHRDGKGNWVACSTNRPGLDEFTRKAYPNGEGFLCQYGRIGENLWVRETCFFEWPSDCPPENIKDCKVIYKADNPDYMFDKSIREEYPEYRWTSAIFMPRWASRFELKILDIKAEKLKDISEKDAQSEGVECFADIDYTSGYTYRFRFMQLWDSINKKQGLTWNDNPWVWVIKFQMF